MLLLSICNSVLKNDNFPSRDRRAHSFRDRRAPDRSVIDVHEGRSIQRANRLPRWAGPTAPSLKNSSPSPSPSLPPHGNRRGTSGEDAAANGRIERRIPVTIDGDWRREVLLSCFNSCDIRLVHEILDSPCDLS